MFYSPNSENNAHTRAAILDYVLYRFICILFWSLKQVKTMKNAHFKCPRAQGDRSKPLKVEFTVMEDNKRQHILLITENLEPAKICIMLEKLLK